MTPAERAVIDAARAWASPDLEGDSEGIERSVDNLAAAVAALDAACAPDEVNAPGIVQPHDPDAPYVPLATEAEVDAALAPDEVNVSARDDWPPTHIGWKAAERRDQMYAEIDRLRRWKAEATAVIERWDALWELLGRPGRLGEFHQTGVYNELVRLRAACAPDEVNEAET